MKCADFIFGTQHNEMNHDQSFISTNYFTPNSLHLQVRSAYCILKRIGQKFVDKAEVEKLI